jgi:hypothetical protein
MTTFSHPTRRFTTAGRPVRVAALTGTAAVVGVAGGRVAISHYGLPAVELLIVVPLLVYVATRPFVGCVLLALMMASVFSYGVLPRASLPGHPPINIADILLVIVVGGTLWRRPWHTWPPAVQRFSWVLALLVLLALPPTIRLAALGHNEFRSAVLGLKTLLYVAVALTIALECSQRLWKPLVSAAIAFAALISIMSLLAAASSGFAHLLTSLDANAVQNAAALGGTARVRLQGLFFVYAMVFPTLVMVFIARDRWRIWRIASLLLMIAAVGVSLNRNMYFGGAVGLLVTVLIGGPRLRHRVLISLVTVVAILAIVVESAVVPAATNEVAQRAQSAVSSQVVSTNSAQARSDEFSHAVTTIAQNPWYGVGWLQSYGSYDGHTPRQGVEDWYLHIATDLGIPVALVWLSLPACLLWYGVTRARVAAEPTDRALIAAGVGAVSALLLSCLVGTYLQEPDSMLMFGVACGLLLAASLRAAPRGAMPIPAGGGLSPGLHGSQSGFGPS